LCFLRQRDGAYPSVATDKSYSAMSRIIVILQERRRIQRHCAVLIDCLLRFRQIFIGLEEARAQRKAVANKGLVQLSACVGGYTPYLL
jgi:hypothetical protein